MPDINLTQLQPEIPNAENPPKRVTNSPIPETPYLTPSIITSRMAREQAKKDLQELSRITGRQYNL